MLDLCLGSRVPWILSYRLACRTTVENRVGVSAHATSDRNSERIMPMSVLKCHTYHRYEIIYDIITVVIRLSRIRLIDQCKHYSN